MSVRLRDSKSAFQIRWIPKYTTLERFLHWMHTASFIPLALTGLVLFAPWLQSMAQSEAGSTVRLIHRIAAIFFGGVPDPVCRPAAPADGDARARVPQL